MTRRSDRLRVLGQEIDKRAKKMGLNDEELGKVLGVSRQQAWRLRNGKSAPGYQSKRKLISEIGFTSSQIDQILQAPGQRHLTLDFFEAADHLGGIDELSERIEAIIGQWSAPKEDKSDYGSPEKWKSIYTQHSDCGRMIFVGEEPAAYWFSAPVLPEVYSDLRNGKNVNSRISLKDTSPLVPGWNSLYFVDFFEDKRFHRKRNRALLESFVDFLFESASDDAFVDRVVANLSSEAIIGISRGLGFERVGTHKEHLMKLDSTGEVVPTEIFELVLRENPVSKFWEGRAELKLLFDRAS